MLRTIDKTDTHSIQKVTRPPTKRNPMGAVHYQTIETAKIGKGGVADIHDTLLAARQAVGKIVGSVAKETAPKSAYPEQQKGYSKSK